METSRLTEPSGLRPVPVLFWWLVLALSAVALADEPPKDAPKQPPQEAPKEANAASASQGQAAPPTDVAQPSYYFQSDDLVRNQDGSLTWFYLTNHIAASQLKAAIDGLQLPGVKTSVRQRDSWQIQWDPTEKRSSRAPPTRNIATDENLLILTFPPAYRDILGEFLDLFDVPEPQVHIKARIVELTLDSNLEYGTSLFFDRSTATSGNPSTFFQAFRTSFRPNTFTAPALSPLNSGLGIIFDDVGMSEGTLIMHIEALQERGAANILSQPGIIATQGQLATLITGQETPLSEVVVTGSSTERITTTFKQTGIRLDFTPLHIGREFVKLRVRPEVSSITAYQEVKTSTSTIQNPVIAQRNAETVVTIRDRMTLIIGGLYAVSDIDDRSGIPILGDIPVLRFLFSKTRKTKVKSELDFFITPNILRQRLDKNIFTPPGESGRLKRLKEKAGGFAGAGD